MEKYRNEIKFRILYTMGIIPNCVTESDKKLEERIGKVIAEHLSDPQLMAFAYLFHCYKPSDAVKTMRENRIKKITVSGLLKDARRAKTEIIRLAHKDTLIQEWGRQWRESQKARKRSQEGAQAFQEKPLKSPNRS
jgi:hypothetical protein